MNYEETLINALKMTEYNYIAIFKKPFMNKKIFSLTKKLRGLDFLSNLSSNLYWGRSFWLFDIRNGNELFEYDSMITKDMTEKEIQKEITRVLNLIKELKYE